MNQKKQFLEITCLTIRDQNRSYNILNKVHESLFNDQSNDYVIGFLHQIVVKYDQQKYDEKDQLKMELQLSQLFYQMEMKKQTNIDSEQVLMIFYEMNKSQQEEPLSIVSRARNSFEDHKISLNDPIDFIQSTQMDCQGVQNAYKKQIEATANPFRIIDYPSDQLVERAYYISLVETQSRILRCVLIEIKNNAHPQKTAGRISKIIDNWQTIRK
ncbi:hypothetical protein pb186bvf_007475 [Paramecium bursaria]